MSRKALSDWIRAVKGSFQISTNPDLRPYWPHGPRPSQELLSTARFKQEKVSYAIVRAGLRESGSHLSSLKHWLDLSIR